MQRKLTQEELQDVEKASWYLQSVIKQCGLIRGGGVVLVDYLNEIAAHGTTDGRPYIEPQPDVGEGYRRATEADKDRRDLEFCSKTGGGWQHRKSFHGAPLDPDYHYRVPIDRIPTDEDAKQRPTVMVRDADGQPWKERRMVAVLSERFYAISLSGRHVQTWMQARFPYPGELD